MKKTRFSLPIKFIAVTIGSVFLWQQIVWAADLPANPLPEEMDVNVSVDELEEQHNTNEFVIANKNAIEDFIAVRNSNIENSSPEVSEGELPGDKAYYDDVDNRLKTREVMFETEEGLLYGKHVKYHYNNEDFFNNVGRIECVDVYESTESYALSFDGLDDYVDLGNISELPMGNSDRTISMWVKIKEFKDYQEFFKYGNNANGEGFLISTDKDEYNNRLLVGTYYCNTAASTISLVKDRWQHIAVTIHDGNQATLYVNGEDAGTSTMIVNTVLDEVLIGKGWNNCTSDGFIQDVRIYERAINSLEVSHLYNGVDITDGMVVEWKINDGNGAILTDIYGDNIGVINGAVWDETEISPLNESFFYNVLYPDDSDTIFSSIIKKDIATDNLITQFNYYTDSTNRTKSLIYPKEDNYGNISYEFMNEDYNGQGFGRISSIEKAEANAMGEISFEYEYYGNTNSLKAVHSYDSLSNQINTYTYYESGKFKSISLSTPDSNDNVYYEYIDENWNSQGYGRIAVSAQSVPDSEGAVAHVYEYWDGTDLQKKRRNYASIDYTDPDNPIFGDVVSIVEYDSGGSLLQKRTYYYGSGTNYIRSKTITNGDASGNVYYRYLDENWNGQGYGRFDVLVNDSPDSEGAMAHVYEYWDGANLQKKRTNYATFDYSNSNNPIFNDVV